MRIFVHRPWQAGNRRQRKAKEGKWNGGFAPYDYKHENGHLLIADDEVEVIRIIFDRYIHANSGIRDVATYLNDNGYTKKLRQNNTIPGFSLGFIKSVLDTEAMIKDFSYDDLKRKISEERC